MGYFVDPVDMQDHAHVAAPHTDITLISLLAPNADALYRSVAGYLAHKTGLRVKPIDDVPWQERQRLLDRGVADIGFVCGAHYVRKIEQVEPPIRLLAAPVMQAARYQGQPIYFSDVIVRAESPAREFADLRGTAWVYNEPRSYSGYYAISAHLALLGADTSYFGRITESGSHQESLRLVLAGAADAAAIDSIVLERAFQLQPELVELVRVVEVIGPSPIPPVVAGRNLPPAQAYALREALLGMYEDEEGRRVLRAGQLARFVAVKDTHYNHIRRQIRVAQAVPLSRKGGVRGAAPLK